MGNRTLAGALALLLVCFLTMGLTADANAPDAPETTVLAADATDLEAPINPDPAPPLYVAVLLESSEEAPQAVTGETPRPRRVFSPDSIILNRQPRPPDLRGQYRTLYITAHTLPGRSNIQTVPLHNTVRLE